MIDFIILVVVVKWRAGEWLLTRDAAILEIVEVKFADDDCKDLGSIFHHSQTLTTLLYVSLFFSLLIQQSQPEIPEYFLY